MKRLLIVGFAVLLMTLTAAADENPKVVLETSKGKIVLELNANKAPQTVKNFLAYVDAGFYSNTVFHRVIPNFMIQGVVLRWICSKKKPGQRFATKPPMDCSTSAAPLPWPGHRIRIVPLPSFLLTPKTMTF